MHRGSRPRGLLGTRGRAGLASTVGPLLVGVILAFAWNMAGSHGPEMPQPGLGLAPTVGTAVDQAADQAWASATPTSTRFPDDRVSPPAGSRGPLGTGCDRARSSGMVRAAPSVDSAHVSACSSPRRLPEARKTASAMSASTTSVVGTPQVRSLQHPDRSGARPAENSPLRPVVEADRWCEQTVTGLGEQRQAGGGIIPVGRRSAAADVSSFVGVSRPLLSLSRLVEARFRLTEAPRLARVMLVCRNRVLHNQGGRWFLHSSP